MRAGEIELESHFYEPADKEFPSSDVLNLVNDEDPAVPGQFNQDLIKVVGIFCLEPDEPVVFEVEILESILAEFMSQLGQQGGFSHPTQAGDDHGVRQAGRLFHICKPFPRNAGIALPEGIELFQEHGFDLIL
jgi:hypothetical protein